MSARNKKNNTRDVANKILFLQDTILREENIHRRTERLRELNDLIKNTNSPSEQFLKNVNVLLYGGKGLDPVHVQFRNEMLPDSYKKLVVDCLCLLNNLVQRSSYKKLQCRMIFHAFNFRS